MSNYSRKRERHTDISTGKSKDVFVSRAYGNNIKGLSMYIINDGAYDFLQEKLKYSKGRLLTLKYIKNNIDDMNCLVLNNISKVCEAIGVNRNSFYETINILSKLGLLMATETQNIYNINPFVMMSSKIKSTNDKAFFQDLWSQKYGEMNLNSKQSYDILSETIIDQSKYYEYLKSKEWYKKTQECKRLSDNRCSRCGSDRALEVHHITYVNLYNENQNDLECLCHLCHAIEHRN